MTRDETVLAFFLAVGAVGVLFDLRTGYFIAGLTLGALMVRASGVSE